MTSIQADSDEDQVGRIVDAAYELLAFQPGGRPQWTDFAKLFVDSAVLALRVFPDDDAVRLLTVTEYMRAQMQHDLDQHGYSETPGERTTAVVGDIASVCQTFTMNFAHRAAADAIDIFSLVRIEERWQIVSVVSDLDRTTRA